MKKISVLSGIGILALTLSSFTGKDECEKSEELSTDNIVFIETEEEIDLGFDTAKYLPIGFNAYAGMELDLNEIDFVETEEEIDLGFDTAEYLPEGFDPYMGTKFDLNEIDFVETEEEIDLGFDTAEYLPVGFNAYSGMTNEPKISLEKGNDVKSLVLEMTSRSEKSKIRLTDENANTIYSATISDGNYAKKFNLKELAVGTYYFSVENVVSSVVFTLDVNENNIKIANTAKNTPKPVFRKMGDKVYVNLFNSDQEKVDIEILDNRSNVVFKESTKGNLIIGKAFNFEKALKGSYTIRINDGEETYYQNITIG